MIINLKELMKPNRKQELLETFCSEKAGNLKLIEVLSELEDHKEYYDVAFELTISDLLKFNSKKTKLNPKRKKKQKCQKPKQF